MSNVPTFWQLNDYQQAALRTEREMEPRDRIGHGALGLAGEAGECADLLKKVVYFGHDLDRDKVRAELGDVLWYLAVLADACGLTLDEVAEANVAKLRKRYGDGWDEQASKDRADLQGLAAREIATEAARVERRDRRAQCANCGTRDGVCEHGTGFLCRGCLGAT